ncbi:mercuric reductase [Hymenobacter caeli]|uniref:Pyruvate/2-oxoglutarate dehydrogenase complex dihydrolipoamide dehydrogenase (E3) component n=1 Tax=Hymenobacter caeli TaxID=2735894 RepID=A0ABX2FU35_9BACT|nr:mercuric reductase [Hymenobacter caeli]NRT19910.1 pyruvate/2-oxoglutarate dehydrogenase complex dihydrolipoamide dehydrogenase (E3) component [Hymenobacter caeli]
MPASTKFDAIIIGSGQAGNPLATALAAAGRKVALIEKAQFGGSCVNYGCVPTKTLLATAERLHLLRTAPEVAAPAVLGAAGLRADLAAAVARKDALLAQSRQGLEASLTGAGVALFRGHAAFTGPRTVRVAPNEAPHAPRDLTAPLVFINTGTRPAVPDVPGLADVPYLTTTQLLDLKELPEHLVILGGGYIGLEFSQMFRRFGSRVTIVEHSPQLLEREDDDVCEALKAGLAADGVEFVLGAEAHRVSRGPDGHLTLTAHTHQGERRVRGTHLLVATGRLPNTDDLGLGFAGIATDEKGFVQVNDFLQTNVRGVYALGDVHGGPQFTHISYDDYRVVRDALLHGKRRSARRRPLPYGIFTEPQVARIGLSEGQAREQQQPYRVAKMPVASIGRAQQTGECTGFWKVLVGPDDRILGAAIVGAAAAEVMAMLEIAMAGRLKYPVLQEMIFAHPTWSEALNTVFRHLKTAR